MNNLFQIVAVAFIISLCLILAATMIVAGHGFWGAVFIFMATCVKYAPDGSE